MNDLRGLRPKPSGKAPAKLRYPEMVPLKIVVKLEPLQIGVFYKRYPEDSKRKIYLVSLARLAKLGSPFEMTSALYSQHSAYFHDSKVPFSQVLNIIEKMIEFIENEINQELEGEDGEEDEQDLGGEEQLENLQFIAEMTKEKYSGKRFSKEI